MAITVDKKIFFHNVYSFLTESNNNLNLFFGIPLRYTSKSAENLQCPDKPEGLHIEVSWMRAGM